MKLNLGCGPIHLDGFINIDMNCIHADLKLDLTQPLPFADNSVDAIYASHIIEHFSRLEWQSIKKDWYRIMKVGGVIEIKCPEIMFCCSQFIMSDNEETWNWWIKTIYGGQEEMGRGQFHKNGFTFDTLKADLEVEGFKEVIELIGESQSELRIKAKK